MLVWCYYPHLPCHPWALVHQVVQNLPPFLVDLEILGDPCVQGTPGGLVDLEHLRNAYIIQCKWFWYDITVVGERV